QFLAGGGDPGLVGVAPGRGLETDPVHRRAFEPQLQQVALQRCIEAGDAMLMGAQAVVMVIMVMPVFMSLGGDQRQQDEGQGEQVAHGSLQLGMAWLLRYNNFYGGLASLLQPWEHAVS